MTFDDRHDGPEGQASDMERREWMAVLSQAADDRVVALWGASSLAPRFTWIRRPEIGSVMVRGRAGGTGAPFNLGEMTVTRATLSLEDGTVGHAYVAGRSRRKAEIAALCDALMQGAARDQVRRAILEPLVREAAEAADLRAAKAGATKVDFFTLVRGEDA